MGKVNTDFFLLYWFSNCQKKFIHSFSLLIFYCLIVISLNSCIFDSKETKKSNLSNF